MTRFTGWPVGFSETRAGGSEAVGKFSENSSVLVGTGVPYMGWMGSMPGHPQNVFNGGSMKGCEQSWPGLNLGTPTQKQSWPVTHGSSWRVVRKLRIPQLTSLFYFWALPAGWNSSLIKEWDGWDPWTDRLPVLTTQKTSTKVSFISATFGDCKVSVYFWLGKWNTLALYIWQFVIRYF